MATAYGLDNENGVGIRASRSNDKETVSFFITNFGEVQHNSRVDFDSKDFLKYMTTLLKNWGK